MRRGNFAAEEDMGSMSHRNVFLGVFLGIFLGLALGIAGEGRPAEASNLVETCDGKVLIQAEISRDGASGAWSRRSSGKPLGRACVGTRGCVWR